jgi:hypothetical protein
MLNSPIVKCRCRAILYKILFVLHVVVPIPPRAIDKEPDAILEAFNAVIPVPGPTKIRHG